MKILALFAYLLPSLAQALPVCPVDDLVPYTWGNDVSDNKVRINADNSLVDQTNINLSGQVDVIRGQEKFVGDSLSYHRENKYINSSSTVNYGNPDFAIKAEKSNYDLANKKGRFEYVDYYLTDGAILGSARLLDVDRVANTEDLIDATYTTCARKDPSWHIKASELYLDHSKEEGRAYDVTFNIKDTPVFYLPYLSFPLNDDRKSGFLFPKLSSSETRGVDLSLPYYFNIAPNQDATFIPRLTTKRGVILGGEYRYLLEDMQGTFAGNYLYEDQKTGESRWAFRTFQQYKPITNLNINALYQRVSDRNYIEDFEDTLDLSSESFLESHLNATYRFNKNYHVFAQVQEYQVSDIKYTKDDKPYSRLPRVLGTGEWFLTNNFSLGSRSELTNFQKDDFVSGIRFDQELSFSYFLEKSYGFINPQLQYRFTSYSLDNQDADVSDQINRSIPLFSVDSGLYFDRKSSWFGRSAIQTLEPRLFYLYVPYRDQSDIPDFDTSEIDSSYDWLFLTNRFNGRDRIGDANQLTLAASTSFIDEDTGKTLAKFSVGQIQYFQDRKVSLLDSVEEDTSHSNLIAEGSVYLTDNLKIRGLVHNDIDANHTEKSIVGFSYKHGPNQIVNFSHLYDDEFYKQIDFSGSWQFNDYWRSFWRWNYSIQYNKSIDILAGIEYADCCWAVRLIARQNRDNLVENTALGIDDDFDTSIYLEFVLDGLGNVGSANTSELLYEVIPGYQPLRTERR